MTAIALLGATGHVGRSLIWQLSRSDGIELFLYARAPGKLTELIDSLDVAGRVQSFGIGAFGSHNVDIVINAIGVGTPRGVTELGPRIFEITEYFDNLILDYLKNRSQSLYLFLSSGAVYGTEMEKPAGTNSEFTLRLNHQNPQLQYALAKINSEAKHRGYSELNIVDLRIFSYFSRFVDPNAGFFISDLAQAVVNNVPLKTNRRDFMRDFVSPQDFVKLIICCVSRWTDRRKPVNACLDVYSREPISKFDLLAHIENKYNLAIEVTDAAESFTTGPKSVYFSEYYEAEKWGYSPDYSSLECIDMGLRELLENN